MNERVDRTDWASPGGRCQPSAALGGDPFDYVLAVEHGCPVLTAAPIRRKPDTWISPYPICGVDGCIPSDMATGNPAQTDEERRLLYVAMTRAKQHLHLVQPLRFFRTHQHRFGSGHTIAPRSRFLPDDILPLFTRRAASTPEPAADTPVPQPVVKVDIGARLRGMWG